ncbi:MAG: PKD domain-containing protein [Candidatus Cloacimonetes bacterium]|nr:PKD domain-containing protein [Candidatus Cloacimonadota bacterium]
MKKIILFFIIILIVCKILYPQSPDIIALEYYFDTDPGFGYGTPIPVTPDSLINENFTVDITSLSTGNHRFYVRTKDEDSKWSLTYKQDIYKSDVTNTPPEPLPSIITAEYYFDTDPGFGNGTPISVTPDSLINKDFTVDLTSLSTGNHRFYVRTIDEDGKWSLTYKQDIYKTDVTNTPPEPLPDIVAAEYYFDTDPGFGNGTPISVTPDSLIDKNFTTDLTGLSTGNHRFYIRTKDENGKWSLTYKQDIYKTDVTNIPAEPLPDIIAAEYYFDTDPGFGNGIPITVSPDSLINENFIADIYSLDTGVSIFNVRILDENGNWSLNHIQEIDISLNAEFSVSDTVVAMAQEIQFNDLSFGNPSNWNWNFGDGNTSIEQNPTHSYLQNGTFDVTLEVTAGDSVSSIIKEELIFVDNYMNVGGTISEDTFWNADTIKVFSEINIQDGVTLTIDPGTYVEFQGHYKLNVQGRILAEGTPEEMITFTINDTTGFSNIESTDGGWHGIRFENTPATNDSSKIVYCIIEYGKAINETGGAISSADFSKLLIKNNLIDKNYATSGGGIYCSSSSPIIESNIINNNIAIIGYGGGIYCPYSSNPTIINNIISNNSSVSGGGIAVSTNSNPYIFNCTIVENFAQFGGGIYADEVSNPTMKNTIIRGNVASSSGNQIYIYDDNSDPTYEFCNIEGGSAAFGLSGGVTYTGTYQNNIDTDPNFAGTGDHPYQLGDMSFCANAGTPDTTGLNLPEFDLAGNSRIFNDRIDIGAYEYHGTEFQPDFVWAESAGGEEDGSGSGICVDLSGNTYVTGNYSGLASFGEINLINSGGQDIFVAKMDNDGNWLWATQAGSSGDDRGYSIKTDINGNSYVIGCYSGSASFGETTLQTYGDLDIFVAKMDSNGNWLWATKAGGDGADTGYSITIDDTGNLLVTGLFRNTATFGAYQLTYSGNCDIFVAKMDANGNWLWATKAGGNNTDVGHSIALDETGNIYVSGYYRDTANFGSYSLSGLGIQDIFVAKMNSNGNWLWATKAGANSHDIGYSIIVDRVGNSYTTGYFSNTAIFGSHSLTSNGNTDIFVAKMDPNGNWLWASKADGISLDGEVGHSISIDSIGNLYITGTFKGATTFDSITITSNGSQDAFISKIDTLGNWVWAINIGSIDSDYGNKIAVDVAGNCYTTGFFRDSTYFGSTELTSNGNSDIFITKFGYDTSIPTFESDFTADSTNVSAGTSIQFTDTSVGTHDAWLWNFGDNATSTEQNPNHIYNTPGTYTVSLTITKWPFSDRETKTDFITITDNIEHGLVAYYPFTNGSVADSSGIGNNGTNNGATPALDRFGNENSAFEFDGDTDHINIGNDASLRLSSWTFSVWLNVVDTSITNSIISKSPGAGDPNSTNYYLEITTEGKYFGIFEDIDGNDSGIETSSIAQNQSWQHVCYCFSNSTNIEEIFVNGQLAATQVNDLVPAPDDESVSFDAYIGYLLGNDSEFNGKLDDIRIYNRAISESEIGLLYDNYDKYLNADFSADITAGSVPFTVQYSDLSFSSQDDISVWEWDFNNDGLIDSYEQNSTWIYQDSGIFGVSLTVTDSDSTVIETKENYITVSGEAYSEDFNNSGAFPVGWTTNQGTRASWNIILDSGEDYSAKVVGEMTVPTEEWLISPVYNCNEYTNISLEFWHSYLDAPPTFDSGELGGHVKFRLNEGEWFELAHYNQTTSGNVSLPIPAADLQNSLQIAFCHQKINASHTDYWNIDDFLIIVSAIDNTPPTVCSPLTGENLFQNSVTLHWIPTIEEHFSHYEIFYDTDIVDVNSAMWSVNEDSALGERSANTTIISGLESLNTYNFIIRALDTNGLISDISNTAIVDVDPEFDPPIISIPIPAQPSDWFTSHTVIIGCTISDAGFGVDDTSIEYRFDYNGNGIYDTAPEEDWQTYSSRKDEGQRLEQKGKDEEQRFEQEDYLSRLDVPFESKDNILQTRASQIICQTEVTYSESVNDGDSLHFEWRASDLQQNGPTYSGSSSLFGIEDDWYIITDVTHPTTITTIIPFEYPVTEATIYWDPISTDLFFNTYKIYYWNYDTVDENSWVWDSSDDPLLSNASSVTTIIPGLAPNTNYYFKITGVDLAGNIGQLSPVSSVLVLSGDTGAPTAPQNLSVVSSLNDIELSWDLGPEADLDYYRVFRDTIPEPTNAIDTVYVFQKGDIPQMSYSDYNSNNGDNYYRISAVDDDGDESGYSDEVNAICNRTLYYISITGSNSTGTGSENNPFATIQYGIDEVETGDTVLVNPGTYIENINYNGKDIIVASLFYTTQDTSYISQTVINGNQNGSVVTFENGEDMTAVLCGIKIKNGHGFGSTPYYTAGGITCRNNSSPSFNNLIISENSAVYGGGIYCSNYSNPILSNMTIKNNYANYYGAGIYCFYSSPSLDNVIIKENSSSMDGGGIYCRYSYPNLTNVVIIGNWANYGGGGICCKYSSPNLNNVSIIGNIADQSQNGGGITCYNNSSPSISNSIFSENTNYGISGGNGNPLIQYSNFWNNGNANFYNCDPSIGVNVNSNANGDSCDIYNNIQLDPLFVDPGNDDYHLTANSPCIDAGDPNSPLNPDGTITDIGAYYFHQSQSGLVADFEANPTSGLTPLSIEFTDLSSPTDSISTWYWDFGDGTDSTYTSFLSSFTHIYENAGIFTVSLTVTDNSDSTFTETKTNYITVTEPQPILSVTPDSLDFEITLTELELYIQNTGTGDLSWSITEDISWLSAVPESNSRNVISPNRTSQKQKQILSNGINRELLRSTIDTVLITINRAGLGAGIYSDSLLITSNGGNDTIFVSMEILDIFAPADPSGLTAYDGPSEIELIWSLNSEPDLRKYKIFRDTNSPAVTLIDSIMGTPPDTTYTDSDVVVGQTYFYRITAEDSLGNESGFSNEDSATPYFVYTGPVWHVSIAGSDIIGDGSEGDPFATIQFGIDTSSAIDTIMVHPGIYYESIDFTGKNIIVSSLYSTTADTTYISQTKINGEDTGSVVIFDSGEDSTAVLTGFTITNGSATNGGGIYCANSSPKLHNLIVNSNLSTYGGGIYLYNSETQTLRVTISGNQAIEKGGGIYVDGSVPYFTNTTISGNQAIHGGGVYCKNSDPVTFRNCTLWGNATYQIAFGHDTLQSKLYLYYTGVKGCIGGIDFGANYGTLETNVQDIITASPMFVEPLYVNMLSVPTTDGNFHLFPFSTYIDAGDPNTIYNDSDGTRNDIGAWYFDQNNPPNYFDNVFFVSTSGNDSSGDGSCNDPFATIQHAVDLVESNSIDSVIVFEGTYLENVQINTSVILSSLYLLDPYTAHIDSTTIDGSTPTDPDEGSVIAILNPGIRVNDLNVTILGFKIAHGSGWNIQDEIILPNGQNYTLNRFVGGGIFVRNCNHFIKHNLFFENGLDNIDEGGGIYTYMEDGDKTRIVLDYTHNYFYNNYAEIGKSISSNGFNGTIDLSYSEFDVYASFGRNSGAVSNYWCAGDSSVNYIFDDCSGRLEAEREDQYIYPDSLGTVLSKVYADSLNPITINISSGRMQPQREEIATFPLQMVNYVSLVGAGANSTIIDAENTDKAFILDNVKGVNIESLKIQNGNGDLGGGVYINNSELSFTDVEVDNNNAEVGGGIYIKNSNSTLSSIDFEGNHAQHGFAGGIYLDDSDIELLDITFTHNTVAYIVGLTEDAYGGGICSYNTDLLIENITIDGNSLIGDNTRGGGIYLFDSENQDSNITIRNVNILNNTAVFGGGIFLTRVNPMFERVLIGCNTAYMTGGAIYSSNSHPELYNVTVTDNDANMGTDGIYLTGQGLSTPGLIVTNSILWSNGLYQITLDGDPKTVTISYTDIEGGLTGIYTEGGDQINYQTGNINDDPLFVNPLENNYHLTINSPCIDTGNPSDPPDPDGTITDMGAFYHHQGGLEIPENIIITTTVNGNNTDVLIQWDEVSGATSYDVYSTDNPDNSFPEGWNLEANTFTNSWGYTTITEKKFYCITALRDNPTRIRRK